MSSIPCKFLEPSTKTVELTIDNFFSYTEAGLCCISPNFRFLNHSFHIKIFPNGETQEKQDFLSLFLYKNGKFRKTFKLAFGLKSVQNGTLMKRKGTWTSDESQGKGFPKFISRSELLAKKDRLVPSGVLIVTCSMHAAESVPDVYARINKLSSNLKDMFLAKKNADVTIKVKEETFSAHRCVLAARSPVLAAMFDNEMTEKKTGFVDIPDCDPEAFEHFLLYLYSGELDSEKSDFFLLYKIADKYDIAELRLVCVDFLINSLSLENFCESYIFAHQFNEHKLLTIVLDFFNENHDKIISSDTFLSLMKENRVLAKVLKAFKFGKKK